MFVFEVPGRPVPKARPRMTKTGHTYTPKATKDYEMQVRAAFLQKYGTFVPLDGPVKLEVSAYFSPPKSASKAKLAAINDNPKHIIRPDIDNIIKAISDALNGIAWVDDSQIWSVKATKQYGGDSVIVQFYG